MVNIGPGIFFHTGEAKQLERGVVRKSGMKYSVVDWNGAIYRPTIMGLWYPMIE